MHSGKEKVFLVLDNRCLFADKIISGERGARLVQCHFIHLTVRAGISESGLLRRQELERRGLLEIGCLISAQIGVAVKGQFADA